MRTHTLSLLGFLSLLSLAACGGAANPEPESADDTATPAAEPAAEEAPAADAEGSDDKAPAEGDAKPESEEPASKASDRSRKPVDTLTAPDTMFVLSFERSEVGEKAEASCSEKHAKDPKKKTNCLSNERKKVTADVMHFVKDDAGTWYWLTSQQKGSTLKQLSKVKFEVGKETDSSVELLVKGKDATVFEVPNDYTVIVANAKYGKMVYEAKVGAITEK